MYACICMLQPKLTDEEGWKRFCLGEKVYLGTSSSHTDAEPEPALDYSKVIYVMARSRCFVSSWIQSVSFIDSKEAVGHIYYPLVNEVLSQSLQLSTETGPKTTHLQVTTCDWKSS